MKRLSEDDRRYVTLDDARARDLAKNDPEMLFSGHRLGLLSDIMAKR